MNRDRGKQFFVTFGLKRCLEEAYANSSPAKRTQLQIQVEQAITHFRQFTRTIPTRDRPDKEHALVDEKIQKLGLPAMSSCRKGYAACCHITVLVSNSEARQLAGMIKAGTVSVDMNLMREQATFVGTDYEYATLPREKNRCVFLGADNTCKIYEKRPTSCRKYMVRSDPKICSDIKGNPEVVASIEVESMASGFADLDRNSDNMAKSILRYLEE